MIRFKDISIPKPCSVDYDSLPGTDVKRFCGSCLKDVYDFREKDEVYLNEFFHSTGKVCGLYYQDQIQKPRLQTQRPIYYMFATKIISLGLFIKTLLGTHDTNAAIINTNKTIQTIDDTSKVKTIYRGKYNRHAIFTVNINIYINNSLQESYSLLNSQTIWLPDSIKQIDQIKLIVSKIRHNLPAHQKRSNTTEQRKIPIRNIIQLNQ